MTCSLLQNEPGLPGIAHNCFLYLQCAGISPILEPYGNPLFLSGTPQSLFSGFQPNPVWSPIVGSKAGFHNPLPGDHAAKLGPRNEVEDTWVEEHFARILETSLDRRGDAAGVIIGLAGALESHANDIRLDFQDIH